MEADMVNRSLLLLSLTLAAFLLGSAALARPADAATQRCDPGNHKHRTVVAGGATVHAQVCVIRFSGRRYKAWVHVTWSGKLVRLSERARLEDDHVGRDTLLTLHDCGIPPAQGHQLTCPTEVITTSRHGITGDGSLTYDVAGDGRGLRTVQLHGSHAV
jgi:hypothetical protein